MRSRFVARLVAVGLSSGLSICVTGIGVARAQQGNAPQNPALPNPPPEAAPSAPSAPDDPPAADSPSGSTLSKADAEFLKKTAMGNLFEIRLGHLAVEKGATQKVKDIGQRLIDDHTKAQDQLQALAARKGLTAPAQLSAEQDGTYDRLSKLSGADFDSAYLKTIAKDHDADVAMLKKESTRADDPDLRAFAQTLLPQLQLHGKMVHGELKSHTM